MKKSEETCRPQINHLAADTYDRVIEVIHMLPCIFAYFKIGSGVAENFRYQNIALAEGLSNSLEGAVCRSV